MSCLGGRDVFFGNVVIASRVLRADRILPKCNDSVSVCNLSTNLIVPCNASEVTVDDDLNVTGCIKTPEGITFDGGVNKLDTYIVCSAWTPTPSIDMNNFNSFGGSFFQRIGDIIVLSLSITFVWNGGATLITWVDDLPIVPSALPGPFGIISSGILVRNLTDATCDAGRLEIEPDVAPTTRMQIRSCSVNLINGKTYEVSGQIVYKGT